MTNGGGYPHEDEKPVQKDDKNPAEKQEAEAQAASKE